MVPSYPVALGWGGGSHERRTAVAGGLPFRLLTEGEPQMAQMNADTDRGLLL